MSKLTILYAEDHTANRENYALILQDFFDTILLAKDGQEALHLYRKQKPDIILLDIKMPILDGIEVAKRIRANDPDIPIIILTAYADQETLLQMIELKLDKFLVKPIEISHLTETLKCQIDQMRRIKSISLLEGLQWDGASQKLFLKNNEIKLTKKERRLIQLLASNAGVYYSHDDLIIHIWEDEFPDHTYNKKLIQLIYRLNKKIAELLPSRTYLIENSYRLGYRVQTDTSDSGTFTQP